MCLLAKVSTDQLLLCFSKCFEDFWEQERRKAFNSLVKEQHLDAEKLEKGIDRYIYKGKEPLDFAAICRCNKFETAQ